jgi:1,2-diacylglycerol 3-alpha-glucosyltransferase
MKILLISDVYFPRINGVSTSIRTFVYQLQKLGHEVTLIAPDYGQVTEDENWIIRVPARKIFFDPEDRLMKSSEVMQNIDFFKKQHYDVIHVHTPFAAHYLGLKLGKLLKVAVVETYHTFFEDYLHLYLPIIPKFIARSIARAISEQQCNAVDGIISPSKPMLDVLRRYGVTQKAEVIPTGLQAHSFKQADGLQFREQYGISKNRPMALFVGRVAYEKNIAFLLKMWGFVVKKNPDALLVIAGEGPAEKSLHKLSESLGLADQVKFIGYLDRSTQLNACYEAANVFVFSSLSETQGLVLLEAMAQSTPVVAIAELGTKSILVEGEGAMIAPLNEHKFAEKVLYLLEDKVACKKLGKQALSYVKAHWTDEVQAAKLVQFYLDVVTSKRF